MTKFKCAKCGHKDEIEWTIKAHGLVSMHVSFLCYKCQEPHTFVVRFPQDKRGIETLKKLDSQIVQDTNYIG
jgi:hypothetical protein